MSASEAGDAELAARRIFSSVPLEHLLALNSSAIG